VVGSFPGVSHVALTVKDVRTSAEWYKRLFQLDPVLDEDAGSFYHIVFALPGGVLFGLHEHHSGDPGTFDETKLGLDHLAFACADRSELEQWAAKLDELGIAHSGVEDHSYGSDVSFRDPDNIALEFFAPPG
ncbi:MAG TPA: VOC family protein, partial [Actinomycetota bacterium]|nr:VOC family protein [Actinomycetota bacterium]